MAVFQWLSLVCLADGVSVSRFKMNNSSIIKHTFSASLSTYRQRRALDEGPGWTLVYGSANSSQRPGQTIYFMSTMLLNFIVSCIAGLIWWDLYPPFTLFPLCVHTTCTQMATETDIYSPSTLYFQLMVLSRSASAILVNNWLDTFKKGVKIHVLIGDQ